MGDNELRLEFLRKLYLLKETTDSIVERAEAWTKTDDRPIPFQQRLMRSPLAQRVVRELIFWSSDGARQLAGHTLDADSSDFQLLENLGSRRLKSEDGNPESHGDNIHTLGLNSLELAARSLSQIVGNAFQTELFERLQPETDRAFDGSSEDLKLLDEKLHEQFYWLGEILDDLGNVIASEGQAEDRTEI